MIVRLKWDQIQHTTCFKNDSSIFINNGVVSVVCCLGCIFQQRIEAFFITKEVFISKR
jgi:hypothetical protein